MARECGHQYLAAESKQTNRKLVDVIALPKTSFLRNQKYINVSVRLFLDARLVFIQFWYISSDFV